VGLAWPGFWLQARASTSLGTTTRATVDGTQNMTIMSLEMTDMPTLQENLTEVEGNPVKFLA